MNDVVANPFELQRVDSSSRSIGMQQVTTREASEVITMMQFAMLNPRDAVAAADRIRQAFQIQALAEVAQYAFARGGTPIKGLSIRAAEETKREWGRLDSGWRVVSRQKDEHGVWNSVIQAFCLDLQNGNRSSLQFPVRHWRDLKDRPGYPLTDERDIYENEANQAARRLRECILDMVPTAVKQMVIEQVEATLRLRGSDVTPEAIAKMLDSFANFGVTRAMIEQRIQRKIDAIDPAQVVDLKKVYASLRDEMGTVADFFELPRDAEGKPVTQQAGVAASLRKVAADRRAAKARAKSEPEQGAGQPAESSPTGGPPAEVQRDEAAVPAPPAAAAGSPSAAEFDRIADAIRSAPDKEQAGLELDAARSLGWPTDALNALIGIYRKHWTEG